MLDFNVFYRKAIESLIKDMAEYKEWQSDIGKYFSFQ